MGQNKWKMAPEQRTEPIPARLRRVPPVIADRVIDLMRSNLREFDEEKWYRDYIRLLMREHEEAFLFAEK